MPYDPNVELKEISEESEEDPTLLATATPPTDDEGNAKKTFTPVVLADGKVWVRKPDSTLEWKNFHLTSTAPDGTTQEFFFTAKDDGDAKRKVKDQIEKAKAQDGTHKLTRLEGPKELDLTNKAETTVDETSDSDKKASAEKRQKAIKAQDDSQPKMAVVSPTKADDKSDSKSAKADKK